MAKLGSVPNTFIRICDSLARMKEMKVEGRGKGPAGCRRSQGPPKLVAATNY